MEDGRGSHGRGAARRRGAHGGGKADFIQVTEIAFDPYNPRRILVGTRDSGIACSADDGATWRTIYDSDKILYITAFHFHPSGSVYISSYGRGLWYMEPGPGGSLPEVVRLPVGRETIVATDGGVLTRCAPPTPRGIAASDRPKLFVTFEEQEPEGDRLAIAGRGSLQART